MIEFGGIYINPYMVSHLRIEDTLDEVAVHITMCCGEVLIERYKTRGEATAIIADISELIDPTLVMDLDMAEEDDDDDEEAQDFRW